MTQQQSLTMRKRVFLIIYKHVCFADMFSILRFCHKTVFTEFHLCCCRRSYNCIKSDSDKRHRLLKLENHLINIIVFKLSSCSECNLFLFWVIPRRLSSNCRRFGTHYLFHLHRRVNFIHLPMKMEPIVSSETSAIRTQTPVN